MNETQPEVWRPIPDCDGWYDASNLGRIRSWVPMGPSTAQRRQEPKILQPSIAGGKRRSMVCICKMPRLVHRLVLLTFVGPCPDGMEGCHNDGNPNNNNINNLRWDTRKSNRADSILHGTHPRGSMSSQAKLTEDQVIAMRAIYAQGNTSLSQIARNHGVSVSLVSQIINRKIWLHV